jgi:7,8-dihydropterin-6-yl-methyl-4-(beta-D-ribofuranosyl)aminobenzene 5'-phosphate synthase
MLEEENVMPTIEDFGTTPSAEVTVLVDNVADLLLRSTETVKRFTDQPLLAEHGFAALVDLPASGTRILWDAGVTETTLLTNMRRMEIDPAAIDAIALSHGHGDHTAAVVEILRAIDPLPRAKRWAADVPPEEIVAYARGRRVAVVTHPAAFRERWAVRDDGTRYGPVQPPPRGAWEAAGAEVILAEEPTRLAPGCWTTGPVPRRSFESAGTPPSRAYREGNAFPRDRIEDDQSLVLHVEGKGLVVVAGCAHAGIVNTVRYAQAISGVERVWAVLGGFHLAPAKADEVQQTIDALQAIGPALVAPSHCTGFEAIRQFAAQMPDAFVQGAVGTTYRF